MKKANACIITILSMLSVIAVTGQTTYISQHTDPTGQFSTSFTGVCAACILNNPEFVADNDLNNNASISITAGTIYSRTLRAKLNGLADGNTMAGFYIVVANLVTALPSVTLTTYKAGVLRETILLNGSLVSLLTANQGNICGLASLDYDEVGITFDAGLSTVALDVEVFYAFGGTLICPTGSLPVKFTSFQITTKNNLPYLQWKAIGENNTVYEIQRSENGINYYTIGRVNNQKSGNEVGYSFLDPKPFTEKAFYRIQSTDLNTQQIVYTKILQYNNLSVNVRGHNVIVSPNPVTNQSFSLMVTNSEKAMYTIQIIDLNAKLQYSNSFSGTGSSLTRQVNLDKRLPAGLYVLKIIRSQLNKQTNIHKKLVIE